MGRLKLLELDNFKSYSGKQVVGPFDDFTCVVGPNGAGKSNMMDAISFVLGVQTRHLRSSNLRDLLHRGGDNESAQRTSVKLVYELDADEMEGYEDDETIEFMRHISNTGASTYVINGREVTYDRYESNLKKIGVLVRARNFLVFQGDIESIAQKTPMEITKLLEQISGSDQLADQYRDLEREKREAEDNQLAAIAKKKLYTGQKREVKDQKEEADTFNQKRDELSNLITDQVMMKLWLVREESKSHYKNVQDFKELSEIARDKEVALSERIHDGKVDIAKDSKALALLEREHTGKFKAVKNVVTQLDEVKAKIKGLLSRATDLTRGLKIVKKDRNIQAKNILDMRNTLANYEARKVSLQNEIDDLSKTGFQLDPEKAEEYSRLREELSGKIAGDQSQESVLDQELKSAMTQISRLEQQKQNIHNEDNSTRKMVADYTKRSDMLKESIKRGKESVVSVKKERQDALSEMESGAANIVKMEQELEDVRFKLRDLGEERQRGHREEKLDQAIESMQRIFSGVYGKLSALCKPIQKKYSQAIAVAAGKQIDAVIVESISVAQECIRYLKDQRAGVCVFLPLESLETVEIPERLRMYAPDYKMCVDLLTCEDKFKPAIQYAFGSTMVCDTLQEARELSFTHKERVKVVTVAGHIISRQGAMTGGAAQKEGRDKFTEREAERLRSRKQELEDCIVKTRREVPTRQEIADLEIKVRSLDTRISYSEADLKVSNTKKGQLEQQLTLKKQLITDIDTEIATIQRSEVDLNQKLKVLRDRIAETETSVLGEFSASIGISNIREYERKHLQKHHFLTEQRSKVAREIATITAQIQYEEKREFDSADTRLNKLLTEAKESIDKYDKHQDTLIATEEKARKALKTVLDKLHTLRAKNMERNTKIKSMQLEVQKYSSERSTQAAKFAREEILLEKCRKTVREVLQKAVMDEVEIPTLDADDASQSTHDSPLEEDFKVSQPRLSVGTADTMSPSKSPGRRNSAASSIGKETVIMVTSTVDLSSMDKLRRMDKNSLDAMEKRLTGEISGLQTEMETMRPNMHADGRLTSVNDKLKDCEDQLQTARKKAQRLSLKFEKVKTDRLHKFEECYKHVSSSLQVIYKDLTKSSKHPMGGTAFLTLDNTNDPYTGGTRFTAMPPMKRFRDMDQLSGGEKTMAALALLFSIHSFRQAPFFVLDEVDAALDNVNVKKICNYIKQRSQDFQCIVISLKDSLFEHANSLVGVAKDIEESTSKVYTLSLREFEDLSLQAADRSVSLNESSYDQSTSQISMQQRSPLAREQKGRTPQSAGTTMRGIPEEKRASPDSGGSATGKRKQR